MSDWRPIKTAPKDGTPVLVVGGKIDPDSIGYDDCYGEFDAWLHDPRVPSVGVWSGEDWMIAAYDTACGSVTRSGCTHWMPLPEPPK